MTLIDTPASSSTVNPFLTAESQGHGAVGVPKVFLPSYAVPDVPVAVHYFETNPFSTAHAGSFVHSTPVASKPELKTPPMTQPYVKTEGDVKYRHAKSNHPFYSSRTAPSYPSASDSDEDDDRREPPLYAPGSMMAARRGESSCTDLKVARRQTTG